MKHNNADIAHIWANQTMSEGEGSNMYFKGPSIFSYGSHFCMAKLVPGNKVLLTDRTYSRTTSTKHMPPVRRAIGSHMRIITVYYPDCKMFEKKSGTSSSNAEHYAGQIESILSDISNTRLRQNTRDQAASQLQNLIETIDEFLEVTGESFRDKKITTEGKELRQKLHMLYLRGKGEISAEQYAAMVKRAVSLEARRKKAEVKKAHEKALKNLEDWLKGKGSYVGVANLKDVYLRKTSFGGDEYVETSKGATVTYKAARILFKLIEAGKDVMGHTIDGYTVISMNGHLHVGCHEIERAEIMRFAKQQGWITCPRTAKKAK